MVDLRDECRALLDTKEFDDVIIEWIKTGEFDDAVLERAHDLDWRHVDNRS